MFANPWMAWWMACWQPVLSMAGYRPDTAMNLLRTAQHHELIARDAFERNAKSLRAMTSGAA